MFQLSAKFRDETIALSKVPREPRGKKKSNLVEVMLTGSEDDYPVRKDSHQARATATDSDDFKAHLGKDGKSFSVQALGWKDKSAKRIGIPRQLTHADQGSDLNVVYPPLVKRLNLQLRDLKEIDHRQLYMEVAGGSAVPLTHWVYLNVEVDGIYRRTWAVVAPGEDFQCAKHPRLLLLLGLPWLISVSANTDIRDESLLIGDTRRGEKRVEVLSPATKATSAKVPVVSGHTVEDGASTSESESDSGSEGSDESIFESSQAGRKKATSSCRSRPNYPH